MSDQSRKISEFLETMDLNEPAPAEEPARQFYFIKKARMLVAKQEAQLGRPLTFCVTTFGCQMGAAFDKCGNRIGYGKGYYDTYLKKHPEYRRIGLAFSTQCVKTIPAESHDVPVEFVVTERGILCQNNYQEIL